MGSVVDAHIALLEKAPQQFSERQLCEDGASVAMDPGMDLHHHANRACACGSRKLGCSRMRDFPLFEDDNESLIGEMV
jgi:hypothetical protein